MQRFKNILCVVAPDVEGDTALGVFCHLMTSRQ